MKNRFRMTMEFDTQLTYDQFRVAALKIGIEIQVPNKIELVYLATEKNFDPPDTLHVPVDCR
jgi:hypothetical protein